MCKAKGGELEEMLRCKARDEGGGGVKGEKHCGADLSLLELLRHHFLRLHQLGLPHPNEKHKSS